MEPQTSFTLVPLLLLIFNLPVGVLSGAYQYSRSDFPTDFVFGSGTSAYQVNSLFLSFLYLSSFLLYCYETWHQ
jgi:hypothetical protein